MRAPVCISPSNRSNRSASASVTERDKRLAEKSVEKPVANRAQGLTHFFAVVAGRWCASEPGNGLRATVDRPRAVCGAVVSRVDAAGARSRTCNNLLSLNRVYNYGMISVTCSTTVQRAGRSAAPRADQAPGRQSARHRCAHPGPSRRDRPARPGAAARVLELVRLRGAGAALHRRRRAAAHPGDAAVPEAWVGAGLPAKRRVEYDRGGAVGNHLCRRRAGRAPEPYRAPERRSGLLPRSGPRLRRWNRAAWAAGSAGRSGRAKGLRAPIGAGACTAGRAVLR